MAVTAIADWSELPMDLLESIVRKLDRLPHDYVRFGVVCESWRLVAMGNRCHIPLNQFPGLMVPGSTNENSQTRRFLQLNHESGYFEDANIYSNKQLEVPHEHACSGSAYGWLFLTDDELNTKLLNPFSGTEIQLPSVATLPPALDGFHPRMKGYVFKAFFSSNPSFFDQQQPRAPVILIIYGGSRPRLAYCKPGDKAWTALECLSTQKYYFVDAIYYKDRFLALDRDGEILALDIGTSSSSSSDHCEVKVTQYACIPGIRYAEDDKFLVELQGYLVVLTKKHGEEKSNDDDDDDDDDDEEEEEEEEEDEDNVDDINYEGIDYRNTCNFGHFRTAGFTMLRLERGEQYKWVKVRSLGDNALFVGYNTSFSLQASEHLGCIPNSIYFTECRCEKAGFDMGIYNLTDKSIKPLCSIGSHQLTKPSPIWVTRLPC